MKVKMRKTLIMLTGIVLMGWCIAVLRFLELGTDPFSAMNIGFASHIPFSYGVTQLAVNLLIFLLQIIFAKQTIGLGSIVNFAGLAFISDFFLGVIQQTAVTIESFSLELLVLVINLVILGFAMSLYMTSGLGVAPYDALAIFLPEKTGLSFGLLRIVTDGSCLLIALLTGSTVGIGTVAIVFLIGPLVQRFNKAITYPRYLKYAKN